ncbi:MAG: metal-dependent hydrolase [Deltaproteobacteria bacterium]|nr:metal-dependent hydrolase [Deltaproteobacteria bacterium]MDQ3296462.1 metal-dependent hydrolase [Myxococcota bacterium]
MTAIVPRDLDVDFATVPRNWLAGSAAATAVANGVNLLFPHGERFFVRSVKHFLDQIDDEVLRAQIKGFFGQEGRHAREHDRFNAILRAQGYEIDRFLESYHRLSTWIEEHTSPKLNLAITAASEHFTAILADGAFAHGLLDACDPKMRALLAWHAAEEIEHKAVAYDVLREVDPSYAVRVTGLAMATVILGGFWIWGAAVLLRQDRVGVRGFVRQVRALPIGEPVIRRVFLHGIRQYLRRSFHPSQSANETLATEWFAARGMTMPKPVKEAA